MDLRDTCSAIVTTMLRSKNWTCVDVVTWLYHSVAACCVRTTTYQVHSVIFWFSIFLFDFLWRTFSFFCFVLFLLSLLLISFFFFCPFCCCCCCCWRKRSFCFWAERRLFIPVVAHDFCCLRDRCDYNTHMRGSMETSFLWTTTFFLVPSPLYEILAGTLQLCFVNELGAWCEWETFFSPSFFFLFFFKNVGCCFSGGGYCNGHR